MALNTTPTTSGQTLIGNIASLAWANTDQALVTAYQCVDPATGGNTGVQSSFTTIADGSGSTIVFTPADNNTAAERLAFAITFNAYLKKKK